MNDKSLKAGVLFALAAYCMWGVAPLYFKLLGHVPAQEIVMHRIVWSVVLLWVLVLVSGKFQQVKLAVANIRVLKVLLISGLLLAGNWLLFIWAVNNDRLLDASLGYYINPLFNALFARLFLQEKLTRLQQLAVFVAVAGVVVLIISYEQVPWIALTLAITFSVYGLLRKKVAVESMPGLLIESCMMLPFALGYWFVMQPTTGNLWSNTMDLNTILLLSGVVTTAPLLCFTAAARRIRYTTLGFFQYIGPSIMFLLAVLLFKEPLSSAMVLTFACVWCALLIYSIDSVRLYRKNKAANLSLAKNR